MASPSEAPIAEGVDQSIPDHETNAVTTATSPSQEKASGDQQIAPVSEPVVSLSPCEEDDDDFPSNCLDDEEWSDQEPFESLREKVNQLCQDIGFGEPSEILEMGGGDFHRIVGLRFSSRTPQRYILRIPRWAYSEDLQHETSDQVAILSFFSRKFKDVPVPSVYAYDSTTNNAIESQYVLQERLPGKPLYNVFYELPIEEKLQITTLIAELISKFDATDLPNPGRIVGDRSLPQTLHTPPPTNTDINITGYRESPVADLRFVEKCDLTHLLTQLSQQREKEDGGCEWSKKMWTRFNEIAQQMKHASLTRKLDTNSVLWVWDISPSNMLISRRTPREDKLPSDATTQHHSTTVTFGNSDNDCHKHAFQVTVDGPEGMVCDYTTQVVFEEFGGKTYSHKLRISDSKQLDAPILEPQDSLVTDPELLGSTFKHADSLPRWEMSGVIDLDDAKSAPRVLTRKPPSWLWIHPDTRHSTWMGDHDDKPERPFTHDELLIKAHFDQTMAQLCPSYLEDAYHRGYWLRRLSRFAVLGLESAECINRFWTLSEEWDQYYQALELDDVDVKMTDAMDEGSGENSEENLSK
ncbi:Protein kinase-like (PK-like) [Glarea lozoyensis ATCC 20868]|uniref:Protein kinase-like (PK-like) n=1 Tax=Glarea lozoyensis (strain ATCC 20868 / MF5171) TaxID=1116229 RepID=S3CWI2_GLAL2|nr:Protein kinase-like (PK-like) [Glarea lozoyensis ATCC 20868]EPE30732.1 Protein kinase-like (PK-like) [Glarea lozoyensis ATCC 20868]